jgi:hypothetical protein
MMETPSSCAAFAAPAWMLCQNTCDVPFGMTAIVVPDGLCWRAQLAETRSKSNT